MKKTILYLVKFLFILAVCFLGIFQIDPAQHGIYMVHILLYFALAVIAHLRHNQATITLFSCGEILLTGWLVQQYGSPILLIMLAPMFSYLSSIINTVQRWTITGLHLLVVNYILWNHDLNHDLNLIVMVNIIMLVIIGLLFILDYTQEELRRIYSRYDELRHRHHELTHTKNSLVLFAKQVEDAAQVGERSRISQQLHDQLGHRLIRAKMMSDAALQIMPVQPDKAVEMFQQVRDQLSTGLDEMRATLRGMRPFTQATLMQSLRDLLEEIGRESGVRTSLSVEGSPYSLYPSQDLVLYKNAKEALSNALKHGQPHEVHITIEYHVDYIVMTVMNDGTLPSHLGEFDLNQQKGLGVSGMQERCQLAGGSLSFKLNPHFTVITTLPITKPPEIS